MRKVRERERPNKKHKRKISLKFWLMHGFWQTTYKLWIQNTTNSVSTPLSPPFSPRHHHLFISRDENKNWEMESVFTKTLLMQFLKWCKSKSWEIFENLFENCLFFFKKKKRDQRRLSLWRRKWRKKEKRKDLIK